MPDFKYSSLPSAAKSSIYLCHRSIGVMEGGDGETGKKEKKKNEQETCSSNGVKLLGVLNVYLINFKYYIICSILGA